MKNIARVLFITSLVLCMVSSLFAQGTQETSQVEAKSSEPVTIVFYTWEDAPHRALVDEFNRTHTDIQVDAKILPSSDFDVKLATLLSGQAEMDCFMEKNSASIYTQHANGFIEPLNKYIAATGKPNDAVEAYKDFTYIGDEIVDIPWRGGAVYTYFNKKVFAEAGIPTPDTYVEKGEWTWQKFEEVSQAIHAAKPEYMGCTIQQSPSNQEFVASQAGDDIVTAEGKIDNLSNVTKFLAMRKRLESTGAMWPLVDMKVTKTHYSKQFYDGKVGMIVIGEWFPGLMTKGAQNGLLQGYELKDYGITRMPCDQPEYITHGHPTFSCVTSYSKKKQAAFEFLAWCAGPEGAAVTGSLGVLPALCNDEVAKTIASVLPDESSVKYFMEPKNVRMAGYTKYGPRVDAALGKLADEFLLGNINEAQFEEKFTADIKNIVETTY